MSCVYFVCMSNPYISNWIGNEKLMLNERFSILFFLRKKNVAKCQLCKFFESTWKGSGASHSSLQGYDCNAQKRAQDDDHDEDEPLERFSALFCLPKKCITIVSTQPNQQN